MLIIVEKVCHMRKRSQIQFHILFGILGGVLICIALILRRITMLAGILLWGAVLYGGYLFRPSSPLHLITMNHLTWKSRTVLIVTMILIMLLCAVPMGLSPHWNGSIPSEVSEYEEMTEAVLNGHVYLDIPVDPKLKEMENPYIEYERDLLGVEYAWDHAYYNGHYYMYFGIVPVFLFFLPVYFLTGKIPLSYQATQMIACFTVLGFFALFKVLVRAFYQELKASVFTFLFISFTVITLWYSTNAPALYCTATLSGAGLMIWSFFFYFRAVFTETDENRQIINAFMGALCGALVLGCRPPIFLANIAVIPLLITYLRNRKITGKLIGKLVLAALPYFIIGGLLMLYNYVRFDSLFEFGQSYQLTLEDQHEYSSFLASVDFRNLLQSLQNTFFKVYSPSKKFPYIRYNGVFINFPIFLSVFGFLIPRCRRDFRAKRLRGVFIMMIVAALLIIMLDTLWTPFLLERYKTDFYFLLSIACFLCVGSVTTTCNSNMASVLATGFYWIMVITVFVSFLLFMVPLDYNYAFYYPEQTADLFDSILFFFKYF